MKKLFIILTACFASLGMMKAANTDISALDNIIYVEPFSAEANSQVYLSFKMKNSETIRAFQFKISLPTGVTIVNDSQVFTENRKADSDDHTLGIAPQDDGTLLFLCGTQGLKPFKGNDGEVLRVIIDIPDGLADEDNPVDYPIILTEMKLNGPDGSYTTTDPIETTLTITGTSDGTIKLNENSETPPIAQSGVNVKVLRTIKGGQWNTICLPFEIKKADRAAVFGGSNPQVAKVSTVDVATSGDITINCELVSGKLSANTPYLIMPEADVSELTASNVNIVVGSPATELENDDEDVVGSFYGTLKAGTVIPKDNLFLSNNKFYYSTGTTTIKGFRGYFYLQDFSTSSPAPKLVINGEATNIDGLQIVDGDGRIYNLNGQHVENPTKKGVYIQNGKKVVMKK